MINQPQNNRFSLHYFYLGQEKRSQRRQSPLQIRRRRKKPQNLRHQKETTRPPQRTTPQTRNFKNRSR